MQIDVKEKKKPQMFDHDNPSSPTEFKSTEPGEPKLTSNHFNPKLFNPRFRLVSLPLSLDDTAESYRTALQNLVPELSLQSQHVCCLPEFKSETQNYSGPDVFKDWPKYLLKSRALNIQDETF